MYAKLYYTGSDYYLIIMQISMLQALSSEDPQISFRHWVARIETPFLPESCLRFRIWDFHVLLTGDC